MVGLNSVSPVYSVMSKPQLVHRYRRLVAQGVHPSSRTSPCISEHRKFSRLTETCHHQARLLVQSRKQHLLDEVYLYHRFIMRPTKLFNDKSLPYLACAIHQQRIATRVTIEPFKSTFYFTFYHIITSCWRNYTIGHDKMSMPTIQFLTICQCALLSIRQNVAR